MLAVLLLTHTLAFMWGYTAQSTGWAHVDTFVAYVKLHTTQRRTAEHVEAVFGGFGIPLTMTDSAESAKLYGLAGCFVTWVLGKAGILPARFRPSVVLPAFLAGGSALSQQLREID